METLKECEGLNSTGTQMSIEEIRTEIANMRQFLDQLATPEDSRSREHIQECVQVLEWRLAGMLHEFEEP